MPDMITTEQTWLLTPDKKGGGFSQAKLRLTIHGSYKWTVELEHATLDEANELIVAANRIKEAYTIVYP